MLEKILSFFAAEPVLAACSVGALLMGSWLGWKIKSIAARRREEELKQAVLEAKGSIPQFESSVRSRERDINRLQLEIESYKNHNTELNQTLAEKDQELRNQGRELRVLTTELTVAKSVHGSDDMVLDGMDFGDEPTPQLADAHMQSRVEKAEAMYAKLRESLAEREAEMQALEAQLAEKTESPTLPPSTTSAASEGKLRLLEDQISSQQATIDRLEHQLLDMRQERDLLSGLVSSRAKKQPAQQSVPEELETQLHELEAEVEMKQQVILNREESMKRLLQDFEQLSRDHKEKYEETAELINQIQHHENERDMLHEQINTLVRDVEGLRPLQSKIDQLETELSDMEASLGQRESWLEKFKVAAANRSEELNTMTAERDALKRQLLDLHSAVDVAQSSAG